MRKKVIIGDVDNGLWKPVGYLQITNSAGVVNLAPTNATGPTGGNVTSNTVKYFCTLQAETTTARFTDVTGLTPSTAVGQILHPGIAPLMYGGSPSNIQIWATAGAVNVLIYR